MPALKIYGRRWHTTSDMLPIPAALYLVIYIVYLAIYGIAIAHLKVWSTCRGDAVHFIVTSAGLIAVFGLSVILLSGVIISGMQGTCFEVRKRRPVVRLLYAQTVVWLLQIFFMIYGTVILYRNTVTPTCWGHDRRKREALVHTMVWTTWGQAIFLLIVLLLLYNSYHGQKSLTAWENRLKALSFCLRCGDKISTPMKERGPPLPSIAQWISQLFASVDLSPTDLTEAVILTAAAQSLSRKMHTKKALKGGDGSTLGGSSSCSSESDESEPRDGEALEVALEMSGEDTDDSSPRARPTCVTTETSVDGTSSDIGSYIESIDHGALEDCASGSETKLALPRDYPEDWTKMAEEKYSETARILQAGNTSQQGPGKGKGQLRIQPGDKELLECLESPEKRRANQVSFREGHNPAEGEGTGYPHTRGVSLGSTGCSPVESLHSVAGSDTVRNDARLSIGSKNSQGSSLDMVSEDSNCVDLREVNATALAAYNKMATGRIDAPPTPKERFGIYKKKGKRKGVRPDSGSPDFHKEPQGDNKGEVNSKSIHKPEQPAKAEPQLPASMAGEAQAGVNRGDGGVPVRQDMEESPSNRANEQRDEQAVASEVKDAAYGARSSQIPEKTGAQIEQAILTPSGQVASLAADGMPIKDAIDKAMGEREAVDYGSLEEATNWARFASAVYAVMPFDSDRDKDKPLRLRRGMTEERVRDAVVEIAQIETEDLLYFSHSDEVLSHLPYMIALCRKTKSVVVAIRGTMSLADLVTDAVVHPECLSGWLPVVTRKAKRKAKGGSKKAYAHSGITSAARAVLEDLEANGVIPMLLNPDEVRRKSMDMRKSHDVQQRLKLFKTSVNTAGKQVGGALPSLASRNQEERAEGGSAASHRESGTPKGKGDAGEEAPANSREAGETAGATAHDKLDTKGWKLVLTGHSLGAGAAALISMKIIDRYPDMKCWAFSPPGGLVSKSLLGWMEGWCTSVVVGKDAVPRMTVNSLSRLMDEMVTSLARVRYHKLRVLFSRWWSKRSRPPPQTLFYSDREIPHEARVALARYHKSTAKKEKAKDMFPPGRVMFLRPIKLPDSNSEKGIKQRWDCIWVTSQELIQEGILVSKKMLAHHSITDALMGALGYSARHHPDNPKPQEEKAQDKKEQEGMANELESVRAEGNESNAVEGAIDMLSQSELEP